MKRAHGLLAALGAGGLVIGLGVWLTRPRDCPEPHQAPGPTAPSESAEPGSLDAALRAFRTHEDRSIQRGTLEWWDRTFSTLESLEKSGKREKVRGLLENLQLVSPEFGGPESAPRFRQMAKQVGLTWDR